MRNDKRVMVVFGTRPEAIKMAPVIQALRSLPGVETIVTVTAQHRDMLDQALDVFGLVPDDDLDVMEPDQALPALTSRILVRLSAVIERRRPDLVMLHGDTTTTFAGALAAFYARIPVAHVEAGLRTGDICTPWPEEGNRKLTAHLAALHFAPTENAAANLRREGIADSAIHVTGNTVVDALLDVAARFQGDSPLSIELGRKFSFVGQRFMLVTCHRRENRGPKLAGICHAIREIADRGDIDVVFPVHPSPAIGRVAQALLGDHPGIHLVEPQEYLPFVYLMSRAHLILTDSGGIQEEAPSIGTPVVVMRDSTERPEAVDAGTVVLAGSAPHGIVGCIARLLDDEGAHRAMSAAVNPYGDGQAASRIAAITGEFLANAATAS